MLHRRMGRELARGPGTSAPESSAKTSAPRYAFRTTRPSHSVYPCHSPGRSTTTESGASATSPAAETWVPRPATTTAISKNAWLCGATSATTSSRSPATGSRWSGKTSLLRMLCIAHLQEVKIGQVLVNHRLSSPRGSGEAGNTFLATGFRGARPMTTTDPTAPADRRRRDHFRLPPRRRRPDPEHHQPRRGGPVRGRRGRSGDRAPTTCSNESPIFNQYVNVWRQNDVLRELTLDPRLAAAATALAGVPLRIWHDQLLIKPPHNGAATEFHQDAPYWPHAGSRALAVRVDRAGRRTGRARLHDVHPRARRTTRTCAARTCPTATTCSGPHPTCAGRSG